MTTKSKRVTANQFDTALLEQIAHAKGMNVSPNVISHAVTFCVLVGNRLYGERRQDARSEAFKTAFQQVFEDARVERAEYAMKERQQKIDSERRIVVPGQSRN